MFNKKIISFILSGALVCMSMPVFANENTPVNHQSLVIEDQNGNVIAEAPVTIKEYINVEQMNSPAIFSADSPERIIEIESEINTSTLRASSASHSDYDYDSSGSVKVWGRITYDKNFSGEYRLTKAEGNTKILDNNTVYVSEQRVRVACRPQIGAGENQDFTFYPSPGAFTKYTGFSEYVNINDPFSRCGMSISVKINRKHNNSSWSLVLPVALTDGFQNVDL